MRPSSSRDIIQKSLMSDKNDYVNSYIGPVRNPRHTPHYPRCSKISTDRRIPVTRHVDLGLLTWLLCVRFTNKRLTYSSGVISKHCRTHSYICRRDPDLRWLVLSSIKLYLPSLSDARSETDLPGEKIGVTVQNVKMNKY